MDTTEHCVGCRDDFYNGKNDLGVARCWYLDTAQMVERVEVGIWERPPYPQPPIKVLNCYRKQGFAYLDPVDKRCR